MHIPEPIRKAGEHWLVKAADEIGLLAIGGLVGRFLGKRSAAHAIHAAAHARAAATTPAAPGAPATPPTSAPEEAIHAALAGVGLADEAIIEELKTSTVAELVRLAAREEEDGNKKNAETLRGKARLLVRFLDNMNPRVRRRFRLALGEIPSQERREEYLRNLADLPALAGPKAREKQQLAVLEAALRGSGIDTPPITQERVVVAVVDGVEAAWKQAKPKFNKHRRQLLHRIRRGR